MRLLALALLTTLGCADPYAATQTMITVDAEPNLRTSLAELRVVVTRSTDASIALDMTRARDLIEWPVVIALVPLEEDVARGYVFRTEALDGDGEVLAFSEVTSGYIKRETRWLEVVLLDSCSPAAICGDSFVRPVDLPTWPGAPDAGL